MIFRLLIAVTFVWVLVTAFVTALTLPSLPQPLLDYVMQHAPDRPLYVPQSADKVLMLAVTVCVGAVSIATIIGLWCFPSLGAPSPGRGHGSGVHFTDSGRATGHTGTSLVLLLGQRILAGLRRSDGFLTAGG